jgi:hypothetical protein
MLDALLKLYASERQVDAPSPGFMIGLLATTIGLVGLAGAVTSGQFSGWVAALAPLLPIPFMAFGALISQVAQARGEVIDEYEREIRRLLVATTGEATLVPLGSTVRRVWTGWYGRSVVALAFVALLTGYVAVVVQSYRLARVDHDVLALAALVLASLSTALIVALYFVALRPKWVIGEVAVQEADPVKDGADSTARQV